MRQALSWTSTTSASTGSSVELSYRAREFAFLLAIKNGGSEWGSDSTHVIRQLLQTLQVLDIRVFIGFLSASRTSVRTEKAHTGAAN
jgi:hypothetical protein